MIRLLLLSAALAALIPVPAAAAQPGGPAVLGPHEAKALALPAAAPGARLKVGTVRALAKSAPLRDWAPTPRGFVARFSASSLGALGLRVRLDLDASLGPLEVRVHGPAGRVEEMVVDPARGPEAWTPWTEGDTQEVEVFAAWLPPEGGVRLGAVLPFDASPIAKAAAGTCTVPTSCSTGDAVLDSAMAQAKKSIMKLTFVEAGAGYLCSATLIDTEKRPAPYVVTANHCIDNATVAASINSFWFYETLACGAGGENPAMRQNNDGMQFVFGNMNVDGSLLLMNSPPPAGAVYSPWSAEPLGNGTAVLSLSHPSGDTSRLAIGTTSQEFRVTGRPQNVQGVRFSRGIIEGGSSGSGLFVLSGNTLRLRGILSGTTVRHSGGMSCTNVDEDALYGRFEIFQPQIAPFVGLAAVAADDAPNRPQDVAAANAGLAADALNLRTTTLSRDNLRIDYPGDLDTFRFTLTAPALVSAWTESANLDTVGAILDGSGVSLQTNDDARDGDFNFGLSRKLAAGTYYVQVGHYDATGTGVYNLRLRADAVDAHNYTDLWGNPGEKGWGLNLNHQGSKLFGALFTYDSSGAPMWLVMSDGNRVGDGAYEGTLFRVTGAAFNAAWRASASTPVGTMRVAFSGADAGALTYTFQGVRVEKSISRFVYSTRPACSWSIFDRTYADNYQDLWSKPDEPGWGVNISHQGDTLFASLYTYDASGRDLWLVMSDGRKTGTSRYSGTLYRNSGPAFDAQPWQDAVSTPVGTMTFDFSNGNAGTLTYTYQNVQVSKPIRRYEFAPVKTQCEGS
ncbi:MAG TPA: PPC domain-containing protein [Usitatibacter sp.]|nr:PPC domain-containing protein [Usitatibacter sp.]